MKNLVIIIMFSMVVMMIAGCDDSDNEKDVAGCKAMAEKVDTCIGWDAFGSTLSEVNQMCEDESYDSYDNCMIDCDRKLECVAFGECMDGC